MIEVEVGRLPDGSWRGAVLVDGRARLRTAAHPTRQAAETDLWQVMDLLGWQRPR